MVQLSLDIRGVVGLGTLILTLTSTYIKDDITLDRLGGVRCVPQFLDITT